MQAFSTHTGRMVPLRRSNVDTDQIIPAGWLKRVSRSGFGAGLFEAWRSDPGFVLHDPAYAGASVLVAGPDFGTGSSREHAVWALQDAGFRAVISPRFADIFRGNAIGCGLLPVVLTEDEVDALQSLAEAEPSVEVTIDLAAGTVHAGDVHARFTIDASARRKLLAGLDDIGLTVQHVADIERFETARPAWRPTVAAG